MGLSIRFIIILLIALLALAILSLLVIGAIFLIILLARKSKNKNGTITENMSKQDLYGENIPPQNSDV